VQDDVLRSYFFDQDELATGYGMPWNTDGSKSLEPPTCPKCGKEMRIRLRGPSSEQKRDQEVTYVCECGADLKRSEGKRPDVDFR
jgi:predicted RNA-binding Zn-ribbon protein involved in translation (DUF1610 family)